MRAIASRLLHRLEIVGGVALLGLRVASIDVIGVRHVFWHATIAFTQAQGHPSTGPLARQASGDSGWSGVEKSVGTGSRGEPAGLHSDHGRHRSGRAGASRIDDR